MSQFFDYISGLIDKVSGFISSTIDNFLKFFKYIGFALSTAKDLITTLPDFLLVFASVSLLIFVLYLVLGRDSGGD